MIVTLAAAVWAGALLGCGIALIIGVVFIIVFYVAGNAVFSGDGKVIFESCLTLLASWLITLLGFAMLKIQGYEQKWENKLQRAAAAQAAARTDPTVSPVANIAPVCQPIKLSSIQWLQTANANNLAASCMQSISARRRLLKASTQC